MKLESVLKLCRAFEAEGLDFWIDGGWGVDALLGEQTRPHSDLDLAVRFSNLMVFEQVLAPLGYRPVRDPEQRVWNPVFHHATDGSVDLHGFVLNANGEGILGELSENSMYPAGALDGLGRIGTMTVRCIAAPFVLMFRNGFEPRDVDHHDVDALCRRFDLKRPSRFS
jgi:lincosamide nucleotidyltransferase A/C/D/E